MAKSDLLKQAIADAKAVKETALANAKIALQEAFAPRLESMLQSKLIGEIEDEEVNAEEEVDVTEDPGTDANAGMGNMPDSVNVGLDFNDDGEYDLTGIIGAADEMPEDEEMPVSDEMPAGDEMPAEDDLNLEEILRELEETDPMATEEVPVEEGMYEEEDVMATEGDYGHGEEDINEIIEAILRETEMGEEMPADSAEVEALQQENAELEQNLEEAYRTVKHLKSVINEVNLLNAKLLYTNKLFRNFDLNESQKMKVIENFDRAVSPREAKLVFATLAESFNKPTQKRRMVKESAASRPTRTTAPSQETTQILSEGFEMANRWKKLAGLI